MKMKILFLVASLLATHSAHAIWTGDNGLSVVGPFTYHDEGRGEQAFMTMGTPLTLLGIRSKLLLDAREDAYYFVATEGQVKSAALASALNSIRNANPELMASDLELSQALLNLE